MDSSTVKQWLLLKRLIERTVAGRVKWEETPASNTYQTSFPNHTVKVAESRGAAPDEPDYFLSIVDEEARVLDRASDSDLREIADSEGASAFQKMRELYRLARRDAMGAERALDDIM